MTDSGELLVNGKGVIREEESKITRRGNMLIQENHIGEYQIVQF